MDISGEYQLQADRNTVWQALNDPAILQRCLPGCTAMERLSDTAFNAQITAKIGALRVKLATEVVLSDIDAPNSYTLTGSGKGGIAGFAKGVAKVMLADGEGSDTLLTYTVQAELGGKLASVGSRLVQGVAGKMAKDFFGKFSEVVQNSETS